MSLCSEIIVVKFQPCEYAPITALAWTRRMSLSDLVREGLRLVPEAEARPLPPEGERTHLHLVNQGMREA